MWTLLAAPAVGVVALTGCGRMYRWPAFGVGLVLALYLLSAVVAAPLQGDLAGFTVYPEDLIFAGLFAVAALRLTVGGRLARRHWPWLLLGVATVVSFAMGSALHGLKPAGVEYRPVFYVLAGCLYCASFPMDSQRAGQWVRLWLWAAGMLTALAWFRWAAEWLQLDIRAQWAGIGGDNPMRVLNAGQTFFLSQAFLTTVYLYRYVTGRAAMLCYAGLLLATVILLQHRSVWVVTAVCCVLTGWRERTLRRLILLGAAAAVVAVPGYLVAGHLAGGVGESFWWSVTEPFDPQRSTFLWRVGLWEQYVLEYAALSGAQTWFGIGFGNPGLYAVGSGAVSNAAHNYFVFTLNRMGILGLALLVLAYWRLLGRLRGAPGRWDYPGLFGAITAGQLVYFLAYSPSFEQGLVAGTALGLVTAARRTA